MLSNCVYAKQTAKTIFVSNEETITVSISTKGTVLSFPAPPSKVVFGSPSQFSVTPVESDLVISPKFLASKSSLFVYVFGRRFSLQLQTAKEANPLVVIRDSIELKKGGAK
jgi:hypothetical protein